MTVALSTEQILTAAVGIAGGGGWLFVQWRKAADDLAGLRQNFIKLLRDEAMAMRELVDAELKALYARIGAIKQNMENLADQLASHRQSANLSLPEFERLAHELYAVETELSAVTARAKEVDRRKYESQLVLSELSADTFDREKYVQRRAEFAAQIPATPPIQLRLPNPRQSPRIASSSASPQLQQKLSEIERHIRALQSAAGQSLKS